MMQKMSTGIQKISTGDQESSKDQKVFQMIWKVSPMTLKSPNIHNMTLGIQKIFGEMKTVSCDPEGVPGESRSASGDLKDVQKVS